jgi:hypothetical protein
MRSRRFISRLERLKRLAGRKGLLPQSPKGEDLPTVINPVVRLLTIRDINRPQIYNKRQGYEFLRRICSHLSPEARHQIRIPEYYHLSAVSNMAEVERQIREFARHHPNTERFFIRGSPVESITEDRRDSWATSMRGHYAPETDSFQWDRSLGPATLEILKTEWLVMKTKPSEKIDKDGYVEFYNNSHNQFYLTIAIPGVPSRIVEAKSLVRLEEELKERIPNKGIAALVHLMAAQAEIRNSENMIQVRFVTWKDDPDKIPEIYDVVARET